MDPDPRSPHRRTLPVTCALHRGPADFANLAVTKRNGVIELDPHVAGGCVILLGEESARVLSEALQEWLG